MQLPKRKDNSHTPQDGTVVLSQLLAMTLAPYGCVQCAAHRRH